jgi:hypothetical protein
MLAIIGRFSAAVVCAFLAVPALAQTTIFNLVLEGAQQVPPVATAASGSGTATYEASTRQLTLNLSYSGLSSAETMAHIHGPGVRGVNAGVLIFLSAGSPKNDVVILSPAQETDLFAGRLYVNIHTLNFPDGEIRGQIDNLGAVGSPRLTGISTRGHVLTGDDVLIGGFIIDGSSPKRVVVRARGPSLGSQGVSGPLADPVLTLVPTAGPSATVSNDNWGTEPNAAEIQALGLNPPNTLESALLRTLSPGAYTAIVTGASNGTGIGIVEVFEVDTPLSPLIGISTRGRVQTGESVMIAGIIITGDSPKQVVVRARGPSLTALGVSGALADPTLTLVPASGPTVTNDDWATAANYLQLQASGFAPTDNKESAILITLAPGAYTAIVSGVGGTTGVAIVEVFEVP